MGDFLDKRPLGPIPGGHFCWWDIILRKSNLWVPEDMRMFSRCRNGVNVSPDMRVYQEIGGGPNLGISMALHERRKGCLTWKLHQCLGGFKCYPPKTGINPWPAGVVLGCKRAPDSPNFDRLLCAYSSPKAAYDIMHEPDAMSLGFDMAMGHGSRPWYPGEHQSWLAKYVHQL